MKDCYISRDTSGQKFDFYLYAVVLLHILTTNQSRSLCGYNFQFMLSSFELLAFFVGSKFFIQQKTFESSCVFRLHELLFHFTTSFMSSPFSNEISLLNFSRNQKEISFLLYLSGVLCCSLRKVFLPAFSLTAVRSSFFNKEEYFLANMNEKLQNVNVREDFACV